MVEATCWTLIEEAAAGGVAAREMLATRYLPLVRAALAARWSGGGLAGDVDDAVQEVFVECLRDGGVLERVGAARPQGFRSFLYGVVRNVARRHEERRALRPDAPRTTTFHGDRLALDETSFEEAFDREWARDLLAQAAERLARAADPGDERAARRVELLRRHYGEGAELAALAREWDLAPRTVYHEAEVALGEFEAALKAVVAFHHPGHPELVLAECRALLAHF